MSTIDIAKRLKGDLDAGTLDGLSSEQLTSVDDAVISTTKTWSSSKIDTDKQNTLVSGTNIKTVNGESILGSGDLSVGATMKGAGYTRFLDINDDLPAGTLPLDGAVYSKSTYPALASSLGTIYNTLATSTGQTESVVVDGIFQNSVGIVRFDSNGANTGTAKAKIGAYNGSNGASLSSVSLYGVGVVEEYIYISTNGSLNRYSADLLSTITCAGVSGLSSGYKISGLGSKHICYINGGTAYISSDSGVNFSSYSIATYIPSVEGIYDVCPFRDADGVWRCAIVVKFSTNAGGGFHVYDTIDFINFRYITSAASIYEGNSSQSCYRYNAILNTGFGFAFAKEGYDSTGVQTSAYSTPEIVVFSAGKQIKKYEPVNRQYLSANGIGFTRNGYGYGFGSFIWNSSRRVFVLNMNNILFYSTTHLQPFLAFNKIMSTDSSGNVYWNERTLLTYDPSTQFVVPNTGTIPAAIKH